MAVLLLPTGAVWYDQLLKPCLGFDVCPLLDSCAGVLKFWGLTRSPAWVPTWTSGLTYAFEQH